MILVIILYLCLASTFTIGKAGLAYLQPLLFVAVRMLIGGALLVGYHLFVKKERLAIARRHLSLFVGMCLFHIYGAYILEYWALQYVSSSKACLLYNLSPFFTALIAYLWSYEIMTFRKWTGLVIGCLGMLPVLLESNSYETISGMFWFMSGAELMLVGSMLCSVIGWLIMRRLAYGEGYSPSMVNGISMLVGGAMSLLTSLVVEGWPQLNLQIPSDAFFESPLLGVSVYIGLLVLIGNIISYNLYGFLLRTYSATFLSLAGGITPLFAALSGHIFLGEIPSPLFFVSFIVVGYGLYVFYQEELKITPVA